MSIPPGEYIASPKLHNESIVRRQISQYSAKTIGLRIADATGERDADSVALDVYLNTTGDDNYRGELIIHGTLDNGTVIREAQGIYTTALTPSMTDTTGTIEAHWQYVVDATEFEYLDHYAIFEPMPQYEALSDAQKFVIEQVTWALGDLFDSTTGGPHLIEEFQTHYGYERLAQLMTIAVTRINMMGSPLTNFVVGSAPGTQFPEQYSNILYISLYIETIKHFIRSYVEQPNIIGAGQIAYADRRDYMQRWQQVLQDELDDFKSAVRFFKRKQMNLGQGSFIVAGGIFATNSLFKPGGYAAATRGARFFPTSFVFSQGRY